MSSTILDWPSHTYGDTYIFAIGIDAYEFCTPLHNAVRDTKAIVEVLTARYQFKRKNVVWLLNEDATRSKILAQLGRYVETVTNKDTLLIYYAGHGAYYKNLSKGYWVPVDGRRNDHSTFVSASEILEYIEKINALHTLVISDSCFSGTLYRDAGIEVPQSIPYEDYVESRPSRYMMTSGRNKVVPDESIFFKHLIQFLGKNQRPALSASSIFYDIRESVAQKGWEPPRYDSLRISGHEDGELVFRCNGAPPLMEDYVPKAYPLPARFVLKPWAWRVAIVAVFTLLLVLIIKLSRHENAPAPEEATQPKPENGIDTTAQKATWTRPNTPPTQVKNTIKDKPDNPLSGKTEKPNVRDTIRKEPNPIDTTRVDPIKPPPKKCKIYVDTKNIANVTVWIPEIDTPKVSNGTDMVSFWIREDFEGRLNIHFTKDGVGDTIRCPFKCGASRCYSITSKIKH